MRGRRSRRKVGQQPLLVQQSSATTNSPMLTRLRGTYCLLIVATLLDILTPELLHNVDKFISACQTYEGGFACSAYPFTSSRAAMAEAHGGYTSCSLLAHFLLNCVKPHSTPSSLEDDFPSRIDVNAALRWSVLMQGEAIEAGGFKGRSNKLVDGCYSWWVGGGFPVLEELARRERAEKRAREEQKEEEKTSREVPLEVTGARLIFIHSTPTSVQSR